MRSTAKVLVVNGSPRKGGNTQIMLDAAVQELQDEGFSVERLSLRDFKIGPCNGCEKCYTKPWDCHIKDDAATVLKRMRDADGLLMGSPVYFGGVTAQMKALFDRSIMLYQDMELKGKVGGAVSCGGGAHGGQELTVWQIATFYTTHDMVVANASGGLFGAMAVANEKGEASEDEEGLKSARSLGRRMAELLRMK